MSSCFQKDYSSLYDLFYAKKDYVAECDYIEKLFAQDNLSKKTVLDLGCGTGGHLVQLSKRNYQVDGVDLSEDMIEVLRGKLNEAGIKSDLHVANMVNFKVDKPYDLIISMFAVIGYITERNDLLAAFINVKQHLSEGGKFIFDCWNGLSVIHHQPEASIKTIHFGDGKTCIRLNSPVSVLSKNVVENHFKFIVLDKTGQSETLEEAHRVRYFFPLEIEELLIEAGFKTVKILPFMGETDDLTRNDFYFTAVASK